MRAVSGGSDAAVSASGESCPAAAVSAASGVLLLLSAPASCSGGRSALTLGSAAADICGNPMAGEGSSAGGASSIGCDLGVPPPVAMEAA